MAVPGFGGLRVLLALAVLDRGAEVSSIPEPLPRQLEARLPGVQVRMRPEKGSRNERLAKDPIVTMFHETVALQLTAQTPWGLVLLGSELFAVKLGCDSVLIVGHLTSWD